MTSVYVTSVNSNETLDLNFNVFLVDATTGSITLTFPLIPSDGLFFTIQRIDSNVLSSVSVVPTSPNTIHGGTISLALSGGSSYVSLGNIWYAIP